MIPKVIHYCWFGKNPLPKYAVRCINSWKKYCPDYEIIEWNESNFDIQSCDYIAQAYEKKKWAFVSDYARFWILYNFGGIYFDTDVELIKPIDKLINLGPFMGYEAYCDIEFLNPRHEYLVNPGLGIAAEREMGLYKKVIDYYSGLNFISASDTNNIKTVVEIVSEILSSNGLELNGKFSKVCGIAIYPEDYFCPLNYANGKLHITDNTVSIHHYETSWQSGKDKFKMAIKRNLPPKVVSKILQIKSEIRNR